MTFKNLFKKKGKETNNFSDDISNLPQKKWKVGNFEFNTFDEAQDYCNKLNLQKSREFDLAMVMAENILEMSHPEKEEMPEDLREELKQTINLTIPLLNSSNLKIKGYGLDFDEKLMKNRLLFNGKWMDVKNFNDCLKINNERDFEYED